MTPRLRVLPCLAALLLPLLAASGPGQVTLRCSISSSGAEGDRGSTHAVISEDGRYVAFSSRATNLVAGDGNDITDVFVHDRMTRTTTRVSVDSAGVEANDKSYANALSADGRYVVFQSWASNLVPGDTNGYGDVFLHDRESGQTTRVSVSSAGVEGNHESHSADISASGRYVVFQSYAWNLVSGDINGAYDIFIHDVIRGTTTRISLSSSGVEGNASSWDPSISDDATVIAFRSYASNLVKNDNNGVSDVFVRTGGITSRVSVDSSGVEGNAESMASRISSDGNSVVFESLADNLVPGDGNGFEDVFLHDITARTTTLISVSSGGSQGDGDSNEPSVSANGRRILFTSEATNLVHGDGNDSWDVFLRDLDQSTTHRVSVHTSGQEGNRESNANQVSDDGRFAAFQSYASNLVGADNNRDSDVFVHGPELTLEIVPSMVTLGDTVTFTTWSGWPGDPALLFLQQVNDTPFRFRVAIGTFDGAYLWALPLAIPPDPSFVGLDLILQSFAPGPLTGRIQATNREPLSIR